MTSSIPTSLLRLATRGSALALWQANRVKDTIHRVFPQLEVELVVVTTPPDRNPEKPLHSMGGDKGLFVKEVEDAIRQGRADAAVHSLKDVPSTLSEDMLLAAFPERADVRDVLVSSAAQSVQSLSPGARVGTSALRRRGQLLRLRPDLVVEEVRGNVDTRIRKVAEGVYDAMILAGAGISRIGCTGHISEWLSPDDFIPAAGQGAICVEAPRDTPYIDLWRAIDNPATKICVETERDFVRALGADCRSAAGALCELEHGELRLRGVVCSADGSRHLPVELYCSACSSSDTAKRAAELLLQKGAAEILQN